MTGSVRSLYNAGAAAAIHEMIFRRLGLNLDPAFFTTNIDGAAGTVTLQALAHAADGTRSPYSGSVTYPLSKLVVDRQLPPTLTWSGTFPPTVDELADYLLLTHGFYLEDGDFYGNGDRDAVPLTRGMTFTGALDPIYQTFQLVATNGSARWAVNSTLTFQQVQSLSLVPLDGMAVTNNAPDGGVDQAYSFSYNVQNGVAPYSFSVVEGSTPAPLDASGTMQSAALVAPGTYDWTVKTTDADGRILYVQDSAQVSIVPLTMNNSISALSVQVADPINIALGTNGGKKPYTYDSTLPATLSIVNDQLVGALEGALAKGTTSLTVSGTVTATDALGSQTTRSFSFTVTDRADTDVQAAIRNKLVHWYEFCEPDGVTYTDNVAGDTNIGTRWDVIADTLNRNNLAFSGLGYQKWADSSTGTPWTTFFGYGHSFNRNSLRPAHAQALVAEPAERFSENFTVWLVMKRQITTGANTNTVQHVFGYGAESNGGWAVKVDQTTGEVLLAAVKDGVAQETRFGPVGADEWGSHYLQVVDNVPAWCHNTAGPVYAAPFNGSMTPNLQDPLTLAIAPSMDATTHFTGGLGRAVVFNDRLWSDERKWLDQYTTGSAYLQPRYFRELGYFAPDAVGNPQAVEGLYTPSNGQFVAVTGTYFALDWPLSGGNGYFFNPSFINLPAGVTLEVIDNVKVRLSGTASSTLAKVSTSLHVCPGDNPSAPWAPTTAFSINAPVAVVGTFPDTTMGVAYDQSLSVTGGTNIRMVTLVAGALPAGLSLYGAGQYLTDGVPRLTGTPTAGGTSSFTLRVQTNDGQSIDVPFTLYVEDPAMAVNLIGTSTNSSGGAAVNSLACATPVGASVGNLLVMAVLRGTDPLSSISPGWVLQLSTPQGGGSAGSQVLDIYTHSNYDNYGSYSLNVPNLVPLSIVMLALSSQTGVTVENSTTEALSHDGNSSTPLTALTPAALGYVMAVVASELTLSAAATTYAVDGDWQALTPVSGTRQQMFAAGKKLKNTNPVSGTVSTNLTAGQDNAWNKATVAFASTPVVTVTGNAADAYYGVDYTATFNLLGGQGAFHYFGFDGTTLGWGFTQVSGSNVLFKGLPDSTTPINATLKVYCDDGQIVHIPVAINVLDNGVAWDAVYPQNIYAVTYSNRARRVDQTDNNKMQTWATKGLNMHEGDGGYFEVKVAGMDINKGVSVGVANRQSHLSDPGLDAYSWAWRAGDGKFMQNNVSTLLGSYQLGDVIGVACRQGKLWMSLNGAWVNGGDPASGTNPLSTTVAAIVYPMAALYYKNVDAAEGHFATGELTYAPPTGFVAWNDLPALKRTALVTDILADTPLAAWTLDNFLRPGQNYTKMPTVDLVDGSRAIYANSPGNNVTLGQNGLLESGHAMLFQGGGYLFHSNNSYNAAVSSLNGDTAFTLLALVRPSQVNVLQTLVHLGNQGIAGTQGILLQLTATGAVQLSFYDTVQAKWLSFVTADGVVTAGTTYLIGVTRAAGGAINVYLNGTLNSSGSLPGSVGLASSTSYSTGASVTVAADLSGSSFANTYQGLIDTVAVYSRALTADQMSTYGQAAGMIAPTVWDAAAVGPNATLSNADATYSADASGWSSAYATHGHQTGKWQYEVLLANGIYSAVNAWVGVQDKTNQAGILQAPIGSQVYGFGIRTNTGDYFRDGFNGSMGHTAVDGDVVGFAVDLDAGTIDTYINGTLVYSSTVTTGKTYYPAASSASGTPLTLQTGALSYPVSGFAQW